MPCCVPVSHLPRSARRLHLVRSGCLPSPVPGLSLFSLSNALERTQQPLWMINSYLSRLNDLAKKLHLIDQSANLDLGQLSSALSKRQTEYSAQHLSCFQSFFSIINHLFRQLFPSCTTLLNRSFPSHYQWVSRETLNFNQNKLSLKTEKQFRN